MWGLFQGLLATICALHASAWFGPASIRGWIRAREGYVGWRCAPWSRRRIGQLIPSIVGGLFAALLGPWWAGVLLGYGVSLGVALLALLDHWLSWDGVDHSLAPWSDLPVAEAMERAQRGEDPRAGVPMERESAGLVLHGLFDAASVIGPDGSDSRQL